MGEIKDRRIYFKGKVVLHDPLQPEPLVICSEGKRYNLDILSGLADRYDCGISCHMEGRLVVNSNPHSYETDFYYRGNSFKTAISRARIEAKRLVK